MVFVEISTLMSSSIFNNIEVVAILHDTSIADDCRVLEVLCEACLTVEGKCLSNSSRDLSSHGKIPNRAAPCTPISICTVSESFTSPVQQRMHEYCQLSEGESYLH